MIKQNLLNHIKEEVKELSYDDTLALFRALRGFLKNKKMTPKQRKEHSYKMLKNRFGIDFMSNITKN